MNISIVVPAYNEGERLRKTLSELVTTGFEIIIVNDGSTDDTDKIVNEFPIHYISHPVNCGQGAALKTGTEYATGLGSDIIAHFDADGQHRIEDLLKLIETLKEDKFDVVLGSRFIEKNTEFPKSKKIILNIAKIFTRTLVGLDFTDPQSGLRAFKTQSLAQLDWHKTDFLHCTEILSLIAKNKLRYKEIPIIVKYDNGLKKEIHPKVSMGFRILFHKLMD